MFFFCDMLQLSGNNEACRAPQSESRLGSTRARCGSWDADYVCLVYKCSSEQIPHFLGLFFPSPLYLYTQSLLFTLCRLSFRHKLQTKKHLVLSHKRFCLLEMSLRATAYAISTSIKSIQMRVFSKISSYPKNRVMTWSLQRKSRWTFWG